MSITWEEREKAEMDRFWAEYITVVSYRSKNGTVAGGGRSANLRLVPKNGAGIQHKPPCPPDTRPWKLKAFIALGLMLWFWYEVAKWL